MDERADCVTANHSQQPQHKQDYGNCIQHEIFLLSPTSYQQ
jgi:hypothetical protein